MPKRLGLFRNNPEYVGLQFSFGVTFKDEFQDNTGLFVDRRPIRTQT